MEKASIEKHSFKEIPPQKEAEPKSPEELIEDLTAEVEELEEVAETEKKLGERFDIPQEEVHEIAEKHGFIEKLSSIKNKIGEVVNSAIEKIKGAFERKEKTFEKTTMETIVKNFDQYILEHADAKAEEIVEFLAKNPENPVPPTAAELQKIKDIAERYEKNRQGLKDFAMHLAKKYNVKKIPENPLELLNYNVEMKKKFLRIIGIKGEINPDDFVIHIEVPSALGVGFKKNKDFENYRKQYGEEGGCKAEAFFTPRDYYKFREDLAAEDVEAVSKLTANVYFIREVKGNEAAKLHETQHQLYAKFFSELKQAQAEKFAFDISKEKLAEIEKAGGIKAVQEYFEKYNKIKERCENLEKNEVQVKALDEMAAYLKEGRFESDVVNIFGRFKNELKGETKHNFEEIKKELKRLKNDGYKAEELYPIMVASKNFSEVIKRLREIG